MICLVIIDPFYTEKVHNSTSCRYRPLLLPLAPVWALELKNTFAPKDRPLVNGGDQHLKEKCKIHALVHCAVFKVRIVQSPEVFKTHHVHFSEMPKVRFVYCPKLPKAYSVNALDLSRTLIVQLSVVLRRPRLELSIVLTCLKFALFILSPEVSKARSVSIVLKYPRLSSLKCFLNTS